MVRPRLPEGVHPDCAMFVPLLGTWRGSGEGAYPTIDPFSYEEEIELAAVPDKPVVAYRQRTWNPATGTGMHVETGYWRPILPDRVEVVIAQPTGLAEVYEGTADADRFELRSSAIAHTTSAKRVDVMERIFRVRGDELDYLVRMAAVGEPLTDHLRADLRRVG